MELALTNATLAYGRADPVLAEVIPQDNGLAPILTAQENLQVVLIARGHTPAEARRDTAIALDKLGLSG
jgi:ABC-type nitrate/sulfonate/bicarbonate transport system ATPase subunit